MSGSMSKMSLFPGWRLALRALAVCLLLAAGAFFVSCSDGKSGKRSDEDGASYFDTLAEAERVIDAQYPSGGIASQAAREELQKIHKSGRPEAEKIRLIEEKFLSGAKPDGVRADGTRSVSLPGGVKLEMVRIPAGSFTMGSPSGEPGRESDEKTHRVALTKDFWLGKYEVTQAQWQAVMGNNPSEFKKGGNYPVEQVSWDDAMAFCRKLNDAGLAPSGWRFDLPTEAQWEYACRAGTTTAFHFGTSLNGTEANCDGNYPYGTSTKGPFLMATCPVGKYRPNAWGLYDMHGNVWEWCSDWYGDYGGDATDPVGPKSGQRRVYRGGSWCLGASYCRAAGRSMYYPADYSLDLGFRLALVRVQAAAPAAPPSAAPAAPPSAAPAAPPSAAPSKPFVLPGGVKLEMVKISAGSFTMGSPADEPGRKSDEKTHRVELTKDFWLGKYEVTQEQWEAVMGNNPSHFKKGGNYPVECVSWDDAMAFCKKLNDAGLAPAGWHFDLPTEAQWEYAARGGNGNRSQGFRYSGGDKLDEVAWHHNNSNGETHPVGKKKPNELGLFDMSGNAWEWCSDWYGAYGGDATDPVGPKSGEDRVRRGGSWDSGASICRVAFRGGDVPTSRDGLLGFRVALVRVP